MKSGSVAKVVARALLRLYPPSFRRDVGEALVDDVRRRAGEIAGSRGPVLASAWMVRLAASLVLNAAAAWGDAARRRLAFRVSWLDLKLAARMLVKYPVLTITGGLGIAVAIAIVVGFFSFSQSRFNPIIPLSEGDRLVGLENWDRRTHREERRSLHDFVVWQSEMQSIQDMAAFQTVARNAIGKDGSVERVEVAEITPSGFRLARVPPRLGRTLVESDAAPGAPPVVVIGFDVWRTRFDQAPDIVGRDLRLGPTIHTIVGVMPEGFAFPVNHRYWTPLTIDAARAKRIEGPSIYISGRLAPGYDLDAAHAELTVIGERMAAQFPDTHQYLRPEVLPYTAPFEGRSRSSSDDQVIINVLFAVPLIVVCANVAILVYARTATRVGEMAVRSALGASRGRLVAQLFAESLVLSALAAAAGLGVVQMAIEWMTRNERQPAFWTDHRLSGSAIAYGAALTMLAAVITGVLPALQATGRRLQTNLCHFNYGAALRLGRTWTTLIVIQVSLAVAAVPIVVSLGWWQLRELVSRPTYAVDQFVAGVMTLESAERFARARADFSHRLDADPGFAGHSFIRELPGSERSARVAIENDHAARVSAASRDTLSTAVDPAYFRLAGVAVLAGRSFLAGDQDEHGPDVVIVNRAFADRVLAGERVLGRRVRYLDENPRDPDRAVQENWYEVVGVVENVEANPIDRALIEPRVYHPLKLAGAARVTLLLRVKGIDQSAAATKLRNIAAAVDPTVTIDTIPLHEIYRMRQTLLNSAAIGIGAAVLSVLLLSAAGIYALMSFTVAQRGREIAIRMSLGAQRGQLLGGVFNRALRQIALGLVIGLGLALLIDATSKGEALMGNGLPLLSGIVIVMTLVGVIAALGPARRGLRIEPSAALKAE